MEGIPHPCRGRGFLSAVCGYFLWIAPASGSSGPAPGEHPPRQIEFENPGILTRESLRLESGPLPPHTSARIRVKVRIRGSWDGDLPGDGPDALVVRLGDGRVLFDTTFSNGGRQAFPDRIRGFSHPSTGSVHILECAVPHTADRLQLALQAVLNETLPENRWNAENESWELLACEFVLSDAPPAALSPEAFQMIWDQLGLEAPGSAWAAVDRLVTADPGSVIPHIRANMDAMAAESNARAVLARIPGLVKALDRGDARARAGAARELSSLTLADLPALHLARSADLSLEGRLRLDEIIEAIRQRDTRGHPHQRRSARLRYALGLIPGPESRALQARFPE